MLTARPIARPTGSPYLPASTTGSPWAFDPASPHLVSDEEWLPASRRLDRHAVAADLRALPSLLEHAYAWTDRMGGRASLDALLDKHARRVEQRADRHPTISARDAFGPVYRDLYERYDENHLWFNVNRAGRVGDELLTSEYRGPVDALQAAARVAGARPETAQVLPRLEADGDVTEVGSVTVRGIEGRRVLHELGYQSVRDAVAGSELLQAWNEPTYGWRMVGDTAVIRLTNFSEDPAALQQFVADAPKHRQAKSIVLDMRGNGGGNDGYMVEWVQQLRSHRTKLPSFSSGGFRTGLAEKLAYWNMGTQYLAQQPGAPGTDEMQQWLEYSRSNWPLSSSTPLEAEGSGDGAGVARSNYRGKVVVLVDRNNGSSGESAALMARAWLGATIIGERTSGTIEGSNVVTYPLPNTGVTITIPSIRSTDDDPRVREGSGIPIDVALARPGAPVEELLPQLTPWLED